MGIKMVTAQSASQLLRPLRGSAVLVMSHLISLSRDSTMKA